MTDPIEDSEYLREREYLLPDPNGSVHEYISQLSFYTMCGDDEAREQMCDMLADYQFMYVLALHSTLH